MTVMSYIDNHAVISPCFNSILKTPAIRHSSYNVLLKESGLSPQQVCDRMNTDYGVELTPSAMSRSCTRGTLSLQRALQMLAICGVGELEIVSGQK